jgi:hypothetical protein
VLLRGHALTQLVIWMANQQLDGSLREIWIFFPNFRRQQTSTITSLQQTTGKQSSERTNSKAKKQPLCTLHIKTITNSTYKKSKPKSHIKPPNHMQQILKIQRPLNFPSLMYGNKPHI